MGDRSSGTRVQDRARVLAIRMHVMRGRADAFVPGNMSNARQVRRYRRQLGQRTVPKVMQRQVPDFLFREASRIARRVPKRWAAIKRAPNQAGTVTASGQQRRRDFAQLNLATEPRLSAAAAGSILSATGIGQRFRQLLARHSYSRSMGWLRGQGPLCKAAASLRRASAGAQVRCVAAACRRTRPRG